MESQAKHHWDEVYRRKGAEGVSWFQPRLQTSLDVIDRIGLPPTASIIDIGSGASTLVDDLLARGFRDVTLLDLSRQALDITQQRLGDRAASVTLIAADILAAGLPEARYDLWHDRAVFHFLTDADARRRYVAAAERSLKPGGHIIVATFGIDGPAQCSGLDVTRYDPTSLHHEFGGGFQPIEHVEESHKTPWGTTQEFVYCYCRRLA